MITGNLALMLNMLAVAVISLFLFIAIISLFGPSIVKAIKSLSVNNRSNMLWFLALMPWFGSLAVTALLLLVPTQYFHWHHQYNFSFASWHAVVSLVFMVALVTTLIRRLHRGFSLNRQVKELCNWSLTQTDSVYELPAGNALAFTAGYFQPACFISSGLLAQLNHQESQVVRLHELAHAERRDPLNKWLFDLLLFVVPKSTRVLLNTEMAVVIEQYADGQVLAQLQDRCLVALTLVKVARLSGANANPLINNHLLCNYGTDGIAARVEELLNSRSEHQNYIFLACAIFTLIVVAGAFSIDIIHHGVESILIH